MTPSFSYGKMSLEIHMPHIVRPLGLEPPPCLVPPGVLGAKPPVTPEYLSYSARRRKPLVAHILGPALELPPSPRRVPVPEGQYQPLRPRRGGAGGAPGPPGAITKALHTLFPVTPDELVSRLPAYPETTAELGERYLVLHC